MKLRKQGCTVLVGVTTSFVSLMVHFSDLDVVTPTQEITLPGAVAQEECGEWN
jgi:hypothetical protein